MSFLAVLMSSALTKEKKCRVKWKEEAEGRE